MSEGGPSGFGRFLVIVLLLFAIGGFGGATLCGGIFTVMSLAGDAREMSGIWVIALPSLLIGGWLCWLCIRTLVRMLRKPQVEAPLPPPAPPAPPAE